MLTRGVRLGFSILISSSFGEYFNDLLVYTNKRAHVSKMAHIINTGT
jgi:hypothetical protein